MFWGIVLEKQVMAFCGTGTGTASIVSTSRIRLWATWCTAVSCHFILGYNNNILKEVNLLEVDND